MGKYEPLAQHLRQREAEESQSWTASFADIERVLGFPLPASARTYREWWANQRGGGHSQTKGWQDAGWQVWKVDLEGEKVIFRKATSTSGSGVVDEDDEEALLQQAAELLGIGDRRQIVREALKGLIAREAGRRLAALGGTMPGFKAPPRRRFG